MIYSKAIPEMEEDDGLRLAETVQIASGLLVMANLGIFIFTVILLCAGIPVPEFRTAVIALLVSSLVSQGTTGLVSRARSYVPAAVAAVVSIAVATAALALCCVNWNLALARSSEWAIPGGGASVSIPDGANPELWVLVHGTRYGNAVIALAALQLATIIVKALASLICVIILKILGDDLMEAWS
ncbi:hypothetical protein RB595_001776 [Gaeumannomyces hyphopodioides]